MLKVFKSFIKACIGVLNPCKDGGLSAEGLGEADFTSREVMVGTVRTAEQLEYTLRCGLYYAPAKFLPLELSTIKYIALHEQEIGSKPGIKRYGRVIGFKEVERGSIPTKMRDNADPAERYYLFSVEEWQTLSRPIKIVDTNRGRPRFTCEFLLKSCCESYQLFVVGSRQDYLLLSALQGVVKDGKKISLGQHVLLAEKGNIIIKNQNGQLLDQFSIDAFKGGPRLYFERVKAKIRS